MTTIEHIDALRDVFNDLTQDCLLLDLTPCTVQVQILGGSVSGYVQFSGEDLRSADALGDSWELPPGLPIGDAKRTYCRSGRFDLDGRRVQVQIVTGCPALPSFPAGYAPQTVPEDCTCGHPGLTYDGPHEDCPTHGRESEAPAGPDAGCSCGARGDLDFILEHVCPLEVEA